MNSENFILINLNQTISRARQAAVKKERGKWAIFSALCIIFIVLASWNLMINLNLNNLIDSRNNTINDIIHKTKELEKDAKINLSKEDIIASYNLGKYFIPWANKLIQLSEMTPYEMSITKLIYTNNTFTISAISKIADEDKKEQVILNDFMSSIRNNNDFLKEFDDIEVKKTKKIDGKSNSYLSFDIVGKLKRRIPNRLDEINLETLGKADKTKNSENNKVKNPLKAIKDLGFDMDIVEKFSSNQIKKGLE